MVLALNNPRRLTIDKERKKERKKERLKERKDILPFNCIRLGIKEHLEARSLDFSLLSTVLGLLWSLYAIGLVESDSS